MLTLEGLEMLLLFKRYNMIPGVRKVGFPEGWESEAMAYLEGKRRMIEIHRANPSMYNIQRKALERAEKVCELLGVI